MQLYGLLNLHSSEKDFKLVNLCGTKSRWATMYVASKFYSQWIKERFTLGLRINDRLGTNEWVGFTYVP